MKFLKKSTIKKPKVSLILLDWSVRESFHFIHYLEKQNTLRSNFEIILIEFYDKISSVASNFYNQIDTWLLLQMPNDLYYHKHLMYNAGIATSNGEICVFCDSDSMVKSSFINSIIEKFENNKDIILHLDQFRNINQNLYPFNYPSFDKVLGKGCININSNKTVGSLEKSDWLHKKNYGACMCATKADLILIGGSDQHIGYLGHICGPYDMTFRLLNLGKKEVWHENEFLFHTWHPGQSGVDNFNGLHDGKQLSLLALESLISNRVEPFEINEGLKEKKINLKKLINNRFFEDWSKDKIEKINHSTKVSTLIRANKYGFIFQRIDNKIAGKPIVENKNINTKLFNELNKKIIFREVKRELPNLVVILIPIVSWILYIFHFVIFCKLCFRRVFF